MHKPMRQDIHNADIPVLCRACEARHGGVCGALTPQQLLKLGRQTTRQEVPSGTELVAAGAPIEWYANILSGIVKLTKLMRDGRQQIVGLQFAPDFMGRPFARYSDVSVEAASTVRLCSFPKASLETMIREAPELEHRLYQQSLRQLDEAQEWMMTLGRKSAEERVTSFLLLVARHLDPENKAPAGPVELPMKRSDIADFLGLTIETVSRQFTSLRKSGVIRIERYRFIWINDYAALEAAAGA